MTEEITIGRPDADSAAKAMTLDEREYLLKKVRSCKKCWGRGYVGIRDGHFVKCTCIGKAMLKILKDRSDALDGLKLGFEYSIGEYLGYDTDGHRFRSRFTDALGKKLISTVALDDHQKVEELRQEHKTFLS